MDYYLLKNQYTSTNGSQSLKKFALLGICFSLTALGATAVASPIRDANYELIGPTSAGLSATYDKISTQDAILEFKRKSGLNWEDLARLFGVQNRAPYLWAEGKSLSKENEEHLHSLLKVLRVVDQGNSRANRSLLLTVLPDGSSPFGLLTEKRYSVALILMEESKSFNSRYLTPLSKEAEMLRMPPPPQELLGALHTPIKTPQMKSRTPKIAKVKDHARK